MSQIRNGGLDGLTCYVILVYVTSFMNMSQNRNGGLVNLA